MLFPSCALLILTCLNAKFLCFCKYLLMQSYFPHFRISLCLYFRSMRTPFGFKRRKKHSRRHGKRPFFLYRIFAHNKNTKSILFLHWLLYIGLLRMFAKAKIIMYVNRQPYERHERHGKCFSGKAKIKKPMLQRKSWNTAVECTANAGSSSAEIFIFCWLLNLHLDRFGVHVSTE